jgi:hypothetical protein
MKASRYIVRFIPILLLLTGTSGCTARPTIPTNETWPAAAPQEPEKQTSSLSRLLESPSISPYEIQQFVNDQTGEQMVDFGPLWSKLQIARDSDDAFDGFIPSYSRWRAEIIEVAEQPAAADGSERVRYSILRLIAEGGGSRRYLVFRLGGRIPKDREWHFSGEIDILRNYPSHEIIEFQKTVIHNGNVFLILRDKPRIGTGISHTSEVWFKIDDDRPREVLKYPVKGARVSGNGSDLEYEAKTITESTITDGLLTQEMNYTVRFGVATKPEFYWLFSKTARAVFVWDQDTRAFKLAPGSDVSLDELNGQFGSKSASEFVLYNLDRLLKLAPAATPEQRAWFGRLVKELPDSQSKAALELALGR